MKAIMYHYVRPYDSTLPYFRNLHIDDFKKQLDFFEKEYGFVSKDDFLESFKTGQPAEGVVLTFDDGVKDHFDYVLPALTERNLWGAFYISTGVYKKHKLLDVHRTHYLLGKLGGEPIYNGLLNVIKDDMLSHHNKTEFRELTYGRQFNDDFTQSVKRILNYYINYDYRTYVLDQLIEEFSINESAVFEEFYLTKDEIKKMHGVGMLIGSHTVSHPVMSKLTSAQQQFEIQDSFAFLENATGGLPVKSFCYPYGGFHTFTGETEQLLTENNCLFSFNVEQRDILSTDLKDRPQALPRYDCNQFPFGTCRD